MCEVETIETACAYTGLFRKKVILFHVWMEATCESTQT
jgi:hypothetical protein